MATKVTIPGIDVPFLLSTGQVDPNWYPVLKFLEKLQPLSDIDNTGLTASILATVAATYSPIKRTVLDKTGTSHTPILSDAGAYFRLTNTSPFTFTVPPHSSVAFTAGTQFDGIAGGAGKVTFAQGSGVTINSYLNNKSLAGQNAGFLLVQTNTLDTWDLIGNLAP